MCTIIEEEWRDIAGYEGKYQVSNLGRVKSLNYNNTCKERCLEPNKNSLGYLQVILCKNGKRDSHSIHRLVAEAFIPNPNNLPQVNHKDENPSNDMVDNLEWCDRKYNINYGTAIERMLKRRNGPRKERPVICVENGVVYPSSQEASRQTGVHQGNIISCCQGRYKSAGGYHWKYSD